MSLPSILFENPFKLKNIKITTEQIKAPIGQIMAKFIPKGIKCKIQVSIVDPYFQFIVSYIKHAYWVMGTKLTFPNVVVVNVNELKNFGS